MTADATAAAVALLLGETSLTTRTGQRIYGTELPDDPEFNAAMPQDAISVQPSGGSGPGDSSYLRLDGQRLDFNFYASTPYRARELARIGHGILKAVRRQAVTYDEAGDESDPADDVTVLLHAFMPSGGFVALREPTTRWPRVLRSYIAIYAEQEIE